ncbi:uncharacterized protein K02A2.6-like, partial [Tigriopus californicus]|uniref:uncharacterized protein K02A2.6-like n=1 Tax=Tigriopus californicus TaxID=6832 RepID=UPI0027D9F693
MPILSPGIPHFQVIIDHRPLLGIFNKPLASLNNTRLQQLRENLEQFSFSISWSAGKTHMIADALSRYPTLPANPWLNVALCATVSQTDPSFKLKVENTDKQYESLRGCISRNDPLPDSSSFRGVADEIHLEDNLLLLGNRLLVPGPARRQILELLHASHSGITKATELAKHLYYWPGMRHEIEMFIRRCPLCVAVLPSQTHEPVYSAINTTSAQMDAVSVDLFELAGNSYLVMFDWYSGFPFVAWMKVTTTEEVWKVLMGWFNQVGLPTLIKSDNGPQFRHRFVELCNHFGIHVQTSSPYHPRSNGLAEAAVKSMKSLLKKLGGLNEDVFWGALLEWRCTPRADGFSPAFGFYGRHLKTKLPSAKLRSSTPEELEAFAQARRGASADSIRASAGHPLNQLSIGSRVHVQNPLDKRWSYNAGEVIDVSNSYVMKTTAGNFRRKRRYLRPAPPSD